MKLSAARVLLLLSGRKGFWKNFSDNFKVILKHCFKSPKTYKGYIKNQFRNNFLHKATQSCWGGLLESPGYGDEKWILWSYRYKSPNSPANIAEGLSSRFNTC